MSSSVGHAAFAPSLPLGSSALARSPARHCVPAHRVTCAVPRASASPSPSPRSGGRGLAHRVATAVAAVSVSVLGTAGLPRVVRAMPAATERVVDGKEMEKEREAQRKKSARYDGKQELGGAEKAISLALTGGAFATLAFMAFRKNREEDALEIIRIKAEVERLEKLKAEFENVDEDEDGLDDDEFFADLKKRMAQDSGESGSESGSESDGGTAVDGGEEDEKKGDDDARGVAIKGKGGDGGSGGSGGMDGAGSGGEGKGDDGADASDIEALKRMWAAESPDKGGGGGGSGGGGDKAK